MLEAKCPSCGAPVRLMTSSSVAAVCSYCGTTVARSDKAGADALENLGKISALVEDGSPLCLSAKGQFEGKRFEIVGRLQLEMRDTGFWNEWFLHYAGGATGWLGEALGQYFMTKDQVEERVPSFAGLKLRQTVSVGGKRYTVTEKRNAKCTGSEGELPFVVGQGYELPFADLRSPSGDFATIDYSEDPPLIFTGRAVLWDELAMKDHREFHGW
jgi:ribosomal protein S27E